MKMYASFFLVLYLTGAMNVKAPPDTLWTKMFGGDIDGGGRCSGGFRGDVGQAVDQTDDGGFIITGWTRSFASGGSDVWLVGTDDDGNQLWSHAWGGEDNQAAFDVQKTSDGGCIIAGKKEEDIWLIRTDELGDTLWTRQYYDSTWSEVQSIRELPGGGFIMVGSRDTESRDRDIFLSCADEWGDKLWTKTYGGARWDEGSAVEQTDDGGFIIVGSTESEVDGIHIIMLIRTNELGESIWTQSFLIGSCGEGCYPAGSWSEGRAVMQTADGGFIVAGVAELWNNNSGRETLVPTSLRNYLKGNGNTNNLSKTVSMSNLLAHYQALPDSQKNKAEFERFKYLAENEMVIQERDAWIIRTNELGDTLRTFIFGGPGWDDIYSISPTADDGYIIAGEKYVPQHDSPDVWLVRGDASGDTLWTLTIGDSVHEVANDVKQTTDDGFIVTATKYHERHETDNMWLLRFGQEPTGIKSPEDQLPMKFTLEQNYPNPFNPNTTIRYILPKPAQVSLKIYSSLGRLVKELVREHQSAGIKMVLWDGTDLNGRDVSTGIYLYILRTGTEAQTRKMILMK